jgi:hypothetical protein
MLNYYHPRIFPFLRKRKYTLPRNIKREYFISFEDALWNLLTAKEVKKNSNILIPDFYCMDVVDNIKNHGYNPIFYPLDDQFQIDNKVLLSYIKCYSAQVLILFHACGIDNNNLKNNNLIKKICKNTIIIEDCVHKLINPEKVILYHKNHFLIDSLRKVSPLPGSFIYMIKDSCKLSSSNWLASPYYPFLSYYYFLQFRLILLLGFIIKSPKFIKYAHEVVLLRHDNLIGDSLKGYKGLSVIPLIHQFINFSKVEDIKFKQYALYTKKLARVFTKLKKWYIPSVKKSNIGTLSVYPLIYQGSTYQKLLPLLHNKGIPVWYKFTDSPWSLNRGVLFLPLGFHIQDAEITSFADYFCKVSLYLQKFN